jgi:hypothetical protein
MKQRTPPNDRKPPKREGKKMFWEKKMGSLKRHQQQLY